MRSPVVFLLIGAGLHGVVACGDSSTDDPDDGGADRDAGGSDAALADAAPEVDPSDSHFEPDHIVEISITLDAADWNTLRLQTRTIRSVIEGDCLAGPIPSPFTVYPASLTVDGTTFDQVGVKKKGFFGSLDTDKPSLKIRFDEHVPGLEYLGLEKLTLNNAHQDPSLLRQCLAYQTFARAGVVVPRCNFAHVRVNGADLGVYVNVEPIDHALTRRRYADGSGPLYEGALSDFRADWVNTFDPKGDGDRSDLQPIVLALESASDAQLVAELTPHLDVDRFITYWAMEVLTNHWDGYANDKNNFFVYNDPTTGQLQFMPWGVDATFQPGATFGDLGTTDGPIAVAAAGILTNRLFAVAATRATFLDRQRELLQTAWSEPALLAELDRMESLIAPIADATQGTGWHGAVDEVRAFVNGRRAALAAALDARPPWDDPLDGYPCLAIVGHVDATFSTTYGTLGGGSPLTSGAGTMSITTGGVTTTLSPIGVVSGLDPDPAPGAEAGALIQVLGVRSSDGHILVASISIPTYGFAPRLVDLGFFDGFGAVFDYDPDTDTAESLGFLLGTMDLTQGVAVANAPVAGNFHANIDTQGTAPALHRQAVAAGAARARDLARAAIGR